MARSRRHLGAAAALAVAGLALVVPPSAGAGPGSTTPAPLGAPAPVPRHLRPADVREPAVGGVLEQRRRAVLAGDREAFLDTLDPQAPEAFRAAQERLFEGLVSLRPTRYELVVRRELGDLSAGLAARYAADDVALPEVEARYRLPADAIDALDTFWYTFVLRNGRWRIAADTDLDDLGLLSARNVWDAGAVTSADSAHFAILFHPEDEARARSLLGLAEDAHRQLAPELARQLPARTVLVLPHDEEELRRVLQATFDLSSFVAFAVSGIDRDDGWTPTAPRVFVQDANLSRYGSSFQIETLHHEMVHVASFPVAGPFVPAWVHEGLADWTSTGRPPASAVDDSDGVLPLDYEFTTGGTASIVSSYRESTSAVAFLARQRGEQAPVELLARLGRARVEAGTWRHHVDVALGEVYGGDLARLEADWSAGSS